MFHSTSHKTINAGTIIIVKNYALGMSYEIIMTNLFIKISIFTPKTR